MPEEVKKPAALPVDINDLGLVGEEVTVNTEGDPFVQPPPPPDGLHLIAMQPLDAKKWEKRVDKRDKPYYMCNLELRLVEPGGSMYDNWPVFDRASTMIMQSSGTCRIEGILRALRLAVPSRTRDVEMARMLQEASGNKPSARIETRWRGYCAVCDRDVVTGMDRFPATKDGKRVAQMGCPKCGADLIVQAQVRRYLPVTQ